ncbi:MAG: NAD(P)H-dependent oxidoreductase [Pseudomonadota bacterium]
MAKTILHIDTSARTEGSQSRALSAKIVERLSASGAEIIRRDIGTSAPPPVDETWVAANFTPEDQRTPAQVETLAGSDALVDELFAADTLVIGLPIYNFGVPAAFKAWIDQVCRARKTFEYTPNGPRGLLEGKKAYILATSGGTEVGSDIDFTTPYTRHVLNFVGITDVTVIAADQLMMKADQSIASATAEIEALEV